MVRGLLEWGYVGDYVGNWPKMPFMVDFSRTDSMYKKRIHYIENKNGL